MLYLVDASVYIFRAYFSLPDSIRDPHGNPVQAVYGFTRFLAELLARERPRYIACAFDESLTSSFRNRLYPPYKANRALPPRELERQLKACRRAARALGIATFASRRYEADDLIGSLAARHANRRRPAVIVSRDKDLAQLIGDGDIFWDYAADERHDVASITRKLGVPPARIPDLLGLAGDAVDNIPGVAGIGAKTAAALLATFGSFDALYANLDRVASLNLRGARSIAERLATGRGQAMLSRELATIHRDIPLKTTLADLRWARVNTRAANRFFNELGFGATLRRQVECL
ncbi:MAG TPA: 5'-3' exonuclease H3TH domain-containing protein [Gammaproteobacteria bacterium]